MASIYSQLLAEVQKKCKTLLPTGVDSANVVIQKVPSEREKYLPTTLPAIIVAPVGRATISATEGTNASDVIRYPILIALLQKSSTGDTGSAQQEDNRERMLKWHQDIRHAFINQKIKGVEGTPYCTVEPGDTFNPAAFFKNHDAGGMVLRFRSKERRGTN